MDDLVWEKSSANDKVVVLAEINTPFAIIVSLSIPMCAHCPIVVGIVSSHLGIHVASHQKHAGWGTFIDCHLDLFVPILLELRRTLISLSFTGSHSTRVLVLIITLSRNNV